MKECQCFKVGMNEKRSSKNVYLCDRGRACLQGKKKSTLVYMYNKNEMQYKNIKYTKKNYLQYI